MRNSTRIKAMAANISVTEIVDTLRSLGRASIAQADAILQKYPPEFRRTLSILGEGDPRSLDYLFVFLNVLDPSQQIEFLNILLRIWSDPGAGSRLNSFSDNLTTTQQDKLRVFWNSWKNSSPYPSQVIQGQIGAPISDTNQLWRGLWLQPS